MNNHNGLPVDSIQPRSGETFDPRRRNPARHPPGSGHHPTGVLKVTVYSSDCELYFGLISARRTMLVLQRLHRHIDEALVELKLVSMTKDAP